VSTLLSMFEGAAFIRLLFFWGGGGDCHCVSHV
jgi:hypothetical protein